MSLHRRRPLATNPELSVLERPGFYEYRLENWHFARDGSDKIIRPVRWSWLDSWLPLLLAYLWPNASGNSSGRLCLAGLCLAFIWFKCSVIHESVIIIPPHGIQLETHWGLSPYLSLVTRCFIPSTVIQDVVIQEGLSGWNVRYYLAVIRKDERGSFSLDVAFQNILPHCNILLEVYTAAQDALRD